MTRPAHVAAAVYGGGYGGGGGERRGGGGGGERRGGGDRQGGGERRGGGDRQGGGGDRRGGNDRRDQVASNPAEDEMRKMRMKIQIIQEKSRSLRDQYPIYLKKGKAVMAFAIKFRRRSIPKRQKSKKLKKKLKDMPGLRRKQPRLLLSWNPRLRLRKHLRLRRSMLQRSRKPKVIPRNPQARVIGGNENRTMPRRSAVFSFRRIKPSSV
ncbi:MAG: hypothetical protein IPN95_16265 [Bacteroidetes bacterium]|nr:hypothetical protein [Bacteroidota bacterium]